MVDLPDLWLTSQIFSRKLSSDFYDMDWEGIFANKNGLLNRRNVAFNDLISIWRLMKYDQIQGENSPSNCFFEPDHCKCLPQWPTLSAPAASESLGIFMPWIIPI